MGHLLFHTILIKVNYTRIWNWNENIKKKQKNLFSKLKSTCWQIYDSIKINKENGNSSGKLCKTICVNNNKRKILSRIKDRCNIWWVLFFNYVINLIIIFICCKACLSSKLFFPVLIKEKIIGTVFSKINLIQFGEAN